MVIDITKEPNDILHKKLDQIEEITDEVKQLAEDMKKALIAAKGVGIAGNPGGKDLAICVIDAELAAEHQVPEVFINPQITEYGRDHDVMEEGCLSVRWLYGKARARL